MVLDLNRQIDFYYFSGTGNTLLVVKRMKETFEKNGISVDLKKIEHSNPENFDLDKTIGLAFPVAGLSTYPFVWKFLNALPPTSGTPVFMVDTLGEYSGGILGPLQKLLKRKGYIPLGACEIIMPWNIFYIQKKKTREKRIKKGLKKSENFALDLVKGKGQWKDIPIWSDMLNRIGISIMGLWELKSQQKWFGFQVKKSKCNKCGICADICPLNNIDMKEYPVYKCKCQFCMRCTSFCPQKAIPCKINYKGRTHNSVKVKELINKRKEGL